MPMRRGLYESRNIVAIQVGMELGEQTIINEARNFGITTPIPPYPSIFIGAADVYPMEMIASYSASRIREFARRPTRFFAWRTRGRKCSGSRHRRARRFFARRSVDHGGHDEGRDSPRNCGRSVWGAGFHLPLAEKRERRTTAPMSGSSDTPPISSPVCGSDSTSRGRSCLTLRADDSPRLHGRNS